MQDVEDPRAVAKREQIVTAAGRLFLESGFAGTSMDAVVAEAQVSKQTLYRYFQSKTDLLAAVLATEVELVEVLPDQPPALTDLSGLRDLLLMIAQSAIGYMLQPEKLAVIRLVFGEAYRIPELRDGLRDALPGQLLAAVADLLRHADSVGLIRVGRPDLTARFFVGPVFSYVALDGFLRVEPLPPPPKADLEFLIDTFLATVEVPK